MLASILLFLYSVTNIHCTSHVVFVLVEDEFNF